MFERFTNSWAWGEISSLLDSGQGVFHCKLNLADYSSPKTSFNERLCKMCNLEVEDQEHFSVTLSQSQNPSSYSLGWDIQAQPRYDRNVEQIKYIYCTLPNSSLYIIAKGIHKSYLHGFTLLYHSHWCFLIYHLSFFNYIGLFLLLFSLFLLLFLYILPIVILACKFLLLPSTLHFHSFPSPHVLCKPCTHTYMVVTMHTQDKLDYLCLMHSTLRTHVFSLCVLSSLVVCCLELLTFPYVHCYV